MRTLQEMFDTHLGKIPQQILEARLAEKLRAAGVRPTKARTKKLAEHILAGNVGKLELGCRRDTTIVATEEDLEYAAAGAKRIYKESLKPLVHDAAERISDRLYRYLNSNWNKHYEGESADVDAFKARLERRWDKALAKLRMLLTIAREWTDGAFHRRQRAKAAGAESHLDDVMLRLLVRACQVAQEIVALLETGLADAAMARWRTLHEIAIVSAVIAKHGEEIAERYVYYQIVESHKAAEAYQRDHKDLGFRPISKRLSEKVKRDYAKALRRFGKKFGEENGWAAHHLKAKEKEIVRFARLEQEAGEQFMRSPYKIASYNVHASPKGVYFKLGNLNDPEIYMLGMSNAGLADPGQHTAVSLAQVLQINIGDSLVLDDLVAADVIERLKFEIPQEFVKAHRKLVREDRAYRKEMAERRRTEAAVR